MVFWKCQHHHAAKQLHIAQTGAVWRPGAAYCHIALSRHSTKSISSRNQTDILLDTDRSSRGQPRSRRHCIRSHANARHTLSAVAAWARTCSPRRDGRPAAHDTGDTLRAGKAGAVPRAAQGARLFMTLAPERACMVLRVSM